jgi:galactosamine-6-phosphate isomerase
MEVVVYDSYPVMSKKMTDRVIQDLEASEEPLFCVASGDSPSGLYKELVHRHDQQLLDVSGWYFLGLDEWIGLNKDNEGSCSYLLDRQLFQPLGIKEEQICLFDGKTKDPLQECQRVEGVIRQRGPIDVAVVGLGLNGHIGLNEPGTSPELHSHVGKLDTITKEIGQKYFSHPQQLSEGITLGIATLMEAKHLILIVSGHKKAAIVQRAMEGEITENVPASLFRNHPDFTVYLDAEAASLL